VGLGFKLRDSNGVYPAPVTQRVSHPVIFVAPVVFLMGMEGEAQPALPDC
jgi:hypothetical protein